MGRFKNQTAEEMISTPEFETILSETEVIPAETVTATPATDESGKTAGEAIAAIKAKYDEDKITRSEKRSKKRRKEKEPSEEELQAKAELQKAVASFTALGNTIVQIVVPRLPNPLPLKPFEQELFNDSLSRALEKYLPKLGGWDVEIALAIVVVVVFAPRLIKAKETKTETTASATS